MSEPEQVIVLMESVHQHMALEENLDRIGLPYRTVVKPRQLGSDCGMALRIDSRQLERLKTVSREAELSIHGIFYKEGMKWVPVS